VSSRAVDEAALTTFLNRQGLLLADESLRLELLAGGRSNLTYALDVGVHRWVLRRPPTGHVLETAHDMGREFTVLTALRSTAVPVPRTILSCADPAVIGAPFYVMDRVEGDVVRGNEQLSQRSSGEVRELLLELVDVLAALHGVDPRSVGLERFGRPLGFAERQVRRWSAQLDATCAPTSAMTALVTGLGADVPASPYGAVVHGDYRLDNCILDGARLAAVLDWEMSTLGDPLTDLGLFLIYYSGFADHANEVVASPAAVTGAPTPDELVERYALSTGFDLDRLAWYVAFAWFKLGVILAGVAARDEASRPTDNGSTASVS
jgi:aminoglycoside phosphotransferase (APT) family kinase protein